MYAKAVCVNVRENVPSAVESNCFQRLVLVAFNGAASTRLPEKPLVNYADENYDA